MIERLVAVTVTPWWLVSVSGWAWWVVAYQVTGVMR